MKKIQKTVTKQLDLGDMSKQVPNNLSSSDEETFVEEILNDTELDSVKPRISMQVILF